MIVYELELNKKKKKKILIKYAEHIGTIQVFILKRRRLRNLYVVVFF